jgi:hypothetical protein
VVHINTTAVLTEPTTDTATLLEYPASMYELHVGEDVGRRLTLGSEDHYEPVPAGEGGTGLYIESVPRDRP